MTREQLEHVIRAAAAVSDQDHLVVIGSQSVLASAPDAPAVMLRSEEADLWPRDRPELADDIDGAIGELSTFHRTFGYHAHGVHPGVATLPPGWPDRLVPLNTPGTRGATGWCLHPADAVLSKLAAGREKDLAYARAALAAVVVHPADLRELAPTLPLDAPRLQTLLHRLDRLLPPKTPEAPTTLNLPGPSTTPRS